MNFRCGDSLFVARKAASHLAEILRVRELRSPGIKNILENEEFPIKARWPEAEISLTSLITVCNISIHYGCFACLVSFRFFTFRYSDLLVSFRFASFCYGALLVPLRFVSSFSLFVSFVRFFLRFILFVRPLVLTYLLLFALLPFTFIFYFISLFISSFRRSFLCSFLRPLVPPHSPSSSIFPNPVNLWRKKNLFWTQPILNLCRSVRTCCRRCCRLIHSSDLLVINCCRTRFLEMFLGSRVLRVCVRVVRSFWMFIWRSLRRFVVDREWGWRAWVSFSECERLEERFLSFMIWVCLYFWLRNSK